VSGAPIELPVVVPLARLMTATPNPASKPSSETAIEFLTRNALLHF
jgi:hypothetical protein